ncbi:hypothetical protein Q7P37_000841 [Cladosporium fusiforme]
MAGKHGLPSVTHTAIGDAYAYYRPEGCVGTQGRERAHADVQTDEPRRSGRATKGQHKNASTSPAPTPNPKPAKAAASTGKQNKKAASQPVKEEEEEEDDEIRCVCGDDNPNDKRAFVSCDACSVWQHNICMGVPEDEDEVGEHYFCERCQPQDHEETVASINNGDKIWETRNKIYAQEKKMSRSRKSKSGKPGWLKKDLTNNAAAEEQKEKQTPTPAPDAKDTGNKRKRESEAPTKEASETPAEEKPARGARQDKRRKSSGTGKTASEDPETAIVQIDKLPKERQPIAIALSKVIADVTAEQVKAGAYRVPDGQTSKSLGDSFASKIEYALQMHHDGPANNNYVHQFRSLHANMKTNKGLIMELLSGSRSPDSMATMQVTEMASEQMQQERAALKAVADRHATIDQKDAGPRYRRTHKGDELIEDESASTNSAPVSRPVRQSVSDAEMAGMSPTAEGAPGSPNQPAATPMTVDTKKPSNAGHERRTSSQQFDVNSIWAKTPQSPTQTAPRPMQVPPRRRSSVQHHPDGAKEDADVDRMLAEDDDDNYAPAEPSGEDSIVWRGKLVQSSGDSEPTVNARFVAGRDVSLTIPWNQMLPGMLNIDGRLQIQKAEEYLCGLQYSSSSDVSVLAFTPYDDAVAFQQFFDYFATRSRYAVVNKDKPSLVKDLYIIPIEPGGKIPDHIEMLEHCTIKRPIEERLLLATFVVARASSETQTPSSIQPAQPTNPQETPSQPQQSTNGHHLPQHMRNSIAGPQGSPLQSAGPQFSPAQNPYAGPNSPIPPNPYSNAPPQPQNPTANTPPNYPPHQQSQYPHPHQQPPSGGFQPTPAYPPPQQPIHNPLAAQILGDLQFTPSAQQILTADPQIGEEKLRNLRQILVENEGARTDIAALAAKLGASSGS